MELHAIAKIHNDFTQKFGIPRQSGLTPNMQSRIIFEPEFANADALRGIEGFSHLWLIWQFDRALRRASKKNTAENSAEGQTQIPAKNKTHGPARTQIPAQNQTQNQVQATQNANWHATVRPPRLGGNERIGVFATRSPFRPNSLGLSVVALERVELHTAQGPILHVSGADIMNNTPIFDIKPYLPYADAYPDARDGFVNKNERTELNVAIPKELNSKIPREKTHALTEVLACDPRPAYHSDENRIYFMKFGNLDVSFKVEGSTLHVTSIDASH